MGSQFSFPKCPYCKEGYNSTITISEGGLRAFIMSSLNRGIKVRCRKCGSVFKVTCKIVVYASKV